MKFTHYKIEVEKWKNNIPASEKEVERYNTNDDVFCQPFTIPSKNILNQLLIVGLKWYYTAKFKGNTIIALEAADQYYIHKSEIREDQKEWEELVKSSFVRFVTLWDEKKNTLGILSSMKHLQPQQISDLAKQLSVQSMKAL